MATISISKRVPQFLQLHPARRFTAREIAEWLFENYRSECEAKRNKSTARAIPLDTDAALIQQLVAEIGSQRKTIERRNPFIRTTEERPRKYYFIAQTQEDEAVASTTLDAQEPSQSYPKAADEHSLYPLLRQFLVAELDVQSMRIDEKRAKNSRGKGGNKWLFPDLVGLQDLGSTWHSSVREVARERADQRSKLWSFEVKTLINTTNVREAYFQAVSNSSWANVGYLVVRQISGTDTLQELRVLSGLHGIGVIQLNEDDPSESQILIPSTLRADIDWGTASRIAEENEDFSEFLALVRRFHQTGEMRNSEWTWKQA